MRILSKHLYRFLPVVLGLLLLWQSLSINYNEHQFKHVIKVDGLGYYSYLPAIFIYQDKNFKFLDTVFAKNKPYSDGFQSIYSVQPDGRKLSNRYSPGLALTQMPFWFVAHLYGKSIHQDQGFEVHYQLAALLSMLFIVFLGILFLHLWMIKKKVNPLIASFILIGLCFGTNLFQYSTFDGSLTHATSFGIVGILIFVFEKIKFERSSVKYFILGGLLCGLLVAIRPVNLLLLPFFGFVFNFKEIKELLTMRLKELFLLLISAGMIILILPLSWYFLSGHWFLYSYGKEVFDFTHPHIYAFLFSYESGFFLYSPFMLFLMLFGTLGLMVKGRWFELGYFIFLFFGIVYVFSSWWDWTYGCSLGCRPFVEFLPLFCIPFVNTVVSQRKRVPEIVTFLLLAGSVFYNQLLSYQYRNRIIDWCDVNEKDYWDVFLKIDKKYAFYTWPEWDFNQYNEQKILDSLKVDYEEKPELPKSEDQQYVSWDVDPLISQNHCLQILPGKTVVLLVKIPPLPPNGKRYYYHIRVKALFTKQRTEDVFGLYFQKDGVYVDLLKSMLKKQLVNTGKWISYEFNGHTPIKEKGLVKMELYVQSTIKENLYLDDLEIRLKEYSESN